jgi:hypothetical protein
MAKLFLGVPETVFFDGFKLNSAQCCLQDPFSGHFFLLIPKNSRARQHSERKSSPSHGPIAESGPV